VPLRLARGYTGRDKIVKFEGCYHGHSDSLLVKAGSGALTLGVPTSPGVPAALAELTITLSYNNIEEVKKTFKEIGDQIACIIVEPVAGNMNCIPPVPGFLEGLREVCDEYGSVLILDEVMSGFRVSLGGAQGQASDIEITAREILTLKEELYKIISKHSGQTYEKVYEDSDRDYWMKADKALEYGMIDEVLSGVKK